MNCDVTLVWLPVSTPMKRLQYASTLYGRLEMFFISDTQSTPMRSLKCAQNKERNVEKKKRRKTFCYHSATSKSYDGDHTAYRYTHRVIPGSTKVYKGTYTGKMSSSRHLRNPKIFALKEDSCQKILSL